ncbi:hypothetical protein STRDD04_00641 [Streptococcus sp. DD04]|nr:hypothetical protein STRDD04_00641 [Streptococcus sp. DD04]
MVPVSVDGDAGVAAFSVDTGAVAVAAAGLSSFSTFPFTSEDVASPVTSVAGGATLG